MKSIPFYFGRYGMHGIFLLCIAIGLEMVITRSVPQVTTGLLSLWVCGSLVSCLHNMEDFAKGNKISLEKIN